MTAARRRSTATGLREHFDVSRRRVSRAPGPPRPGLRYTPIARDERAAPARRIEDLAGAHPRFGYRRIRAPLVREGRSVNKEAVRRVWRTSGLKPAGPRAAAKPRRPRGQGANACHPRPSRGKGDVRAWDFILDRTGDGRSPEWSSLVDEYPRECPALEACRGMTAEEIRVILAEVATRRGGPPRRARSDNGPEFAAEVVRGWLEGTGSGAPYVAPASPRQDGYAGSFHGRPRDELLDREEFESPSQARASGVLWRKESNTERPHGSLGYKTPAEFAATCARYAPLEGGPKEPMDTEQTHR